MRDGAIITLALDASAAMENIFFKSFSRRLDLHVARVRAEADFCHDL
jgi:hypothetical protein